MAPLLALAPLPLLFEKPLRNAVVDVVAFIIVKLEVVQLMVQELLILILWVFWPQQLLRVSVPADIVDELVVHGIDAYVVITKVGALREITVK